MASLQRDVINRAAAKAAATARKAAAAVSRTGQVSRTSIAVRDDDVMLDELMAGAVDTAEVTVEHGEDLALVDDAAVADFETILDAGGAADVGDVIDAADALPDLGEEFEAEAEAAEQNHVAHMLAIEATQNVDEAREKSEQAAVEASLALTTANGKNARRTGVTEPEPPDGGWVQGDQWMRLDWVDEAAGTTRPAEVLVWNGERFVRDQLVVDSLLAVGDDGNVYIDDGKVTAAALAADAIDAKTIRGAQLYGGYIEAPIIASSDKLGTGANKLEDPEFQSAFDTTWIASGHLGDPEATQTDVINWDQTWTFPKLATGKNLTYRNRGGVTAVRKFRASARSVGSVIFANHSMFSKSARTFTNPYTFKNFTSWNVGHGQYGGDIDPSFRAVDAAALLPGTARTTYLTNSAIIAVSAGDIWNMRLEAFRIPAERLTYIDELAVEVVSVSTGSVVFKHKLSESEAVTGQVNVAWVCQYSGSVKFRVKATYRAGALASVREVTASSYSRWTEDGTLRDEWLGSSGKNKLPYASTPSFGANNGSGGVHGTASLSAHHTTFQLTRAVMAQVEPAQGWRLSEALGFELFNNSGQRTALLDGQNNYFSGNISTAESGARFELASDGLAIYDAVGVKNGVLGRDGAKFKFTAPVVFNVDTGWTNVGVAPGLSGTIKARIVHGECELRYDITVPSSGADIEISQPLPERFTPSNEVTGIQPLDTYIDPSTARGSTGVYLSVASMVIRCATGTPRATRVRGATTWKLA